MVDGALKCCRRFAENADSKTRGLDVSNVDVEVPEQVASLVGISRQMVAEIEYENDDWSSQMTPGKRWEHMRKWVQSHIKKDETTCEG